MQATTCLPLDPDPLDELTRFVERHPRLFVLTGAGCSTDSGIPDYRDAEGAWKHRPPVQYQDFLGSESTRRYYWARSLLGWGRVAAARPNATHRALAGLEGAGLVHQLVTQNVDGLHQKAGSRRVIDLHGRLDTVDCLDCHGRRPRAAVQQALAVQAPDLALQDATAAPDGDARLENFDFDRLAIPGCPDCGGILKPSVVFFGESVPRPRVERALARLEEADALLALGTSLMVYSGYRFCRAAVAQDKPIAIVNLGRTRADAEAALKITASCAEVLSGLAGRLGSP